MGSLDHVSRLDHRFTGKGPPLLFETMASRAIPPYRDSLGIEHTREWSNVQARCATWPEAEAQHERIVAMMRQPGDEVKQLEPEPITL